MDKLVSQFGQYHFSYMMVVIKNLLTEWRKVQIYTGHKGKYDWHLEVKYCLRVLNGTTGVKTITIQLPCNIFYQNVLLC